VLDTGYMKLTYLYQKTVPAVCRNLKADCCMELSLTMLGDLNKPATSLLSDIINFLLRMKFIFVCKVHIFSLFSFFKMKLSRLTRSPTRVYVGASVFPMCQLMN
jgi:hypothetical protein